MFGRRCRDLSQYLLQLMLVRGIGEKAIKKILQYVHDSGKSLQSLCESPEMIESVLGKRINTQIIIKGIMDNATIARDLGMHLETEGVKIFTEYDASYPASLKECLRNDCPPVLFVKGNEQLLSTLSVGFCGSRKVSEKGEYITEQCAKQLVEHGITVVSGYASGTDLVAHSSALRNNGNTIFVLAEGILNYKIKQQIKPFIKASNYVFVSQFLPTSQWNVGNAMRRNSLIIGLSSAMILVEAGRTGGTFAAGETTLRFQKPLYVIDFEKPEVSAEANPYFIERGGNPIRGIDGIPNLRKLFLELNNRTENSTIEQLRIDAFLHT